MSKSKKSIAKTSNPRVSTPNPLRVLTLNTHKKFVSGNKSSPSPSSSKNSTPTSDETSGYSPFLSQNPPNYISSPPQQFPIFPPYFQSPRQSHHSQLQLSQIYHNQQLLSQFDYLNTSPQTYYHSFPRSQNISQYEEPPFDSHTHQNFDYSSQFHSEQNYDTHDSSEPIIDDINEVEILPESTMPRTGKQKNYVLVEDELLTRLWLKNSEDAIKGVDQKHGDFWETIVTEFNKESKSQIQRKYKSLSCRWGTLLGFYHKFSDDVATVNKRNESGKTEKDKLVLAAEMFHDDLGQPFKWLSIWDDVRTHPRFIQAQKALEQKSRMERAKKQVLIDVGDDDLREIRKRSDERPDGRKLEKEKQAATTQNTNAISQNSEVFNKFVNYYSGRLDEKAELEKKKLHLFEEQGRVKLLNAQAKAEKEKRKKIEALQKKREADQAILNIDLEQLHGVKKLYYKKQQERIMKELEEEFDM